jgi:glycosyltransferase involved in cell wall biosynthesis
MKIALVHDFITVWGGAERVLLEMHKLYPEAPIYTAVADPALVAKHFPNTEVITSPLNKSWRRKSASLLLPAMPQAIESLDFTGFDVVLSSSGAFAHGIITGPDTHHISYCHSPMRFVWDWHAEFMKERSLTEGWVKPFLANQAMHKLRNWDAVSAKRVDTWVANSKTVQGRIKKFYRADSVVINPFVDMSYFDPALLTQPIKKGNHMFTVSRISVTKKIDQMIEACAIAGIPLKVAGTGDDTWFRKFAAEKGADVTFLGEVTEEQKRQELAEAAGLIFAAEDDFGIVPVEAMAMGTPVVALGKGGATETVVDGLTGIFYPESSAESLAAALTQFKTEGVKGTAETIRKRANLFSVEKFRTAISELVEAHA